MATGFAGSFLLGPVGPLMFSTLTSYFASGGDSLKAVFKKAFNPVIKASIKVGSTIRNSKWKMVSALAIATTIIGIPVAAMLAPVFGPLLNSFVSGPLAGATASAVLSGSSAHMIPITIGAIILATFGMVKSSGTLNRDDPHRQRFIELFEDHYLLETEEQLDNLVKNYFGNKISYQDLSSIIDIYKDYQFDIESSMSKEEFVKQLKRNFPDLNNYQLSMLFTGKAAWASQKSRQSPLSMHRQLKYHIDKSIKGTDNYQEIKSLAAQYKNSKLEQCIQAKKPIGYIRITESLQELYASFLKGDVKFHTTIFSKMLYPEYPGKYITDKQNLKSESHGIKKTPKTVISTYFDLEDRIANLKMEDTKIKDEKDFEKFKDQAKALIRWHFLQDGYVFAGALREASIIYNTLYLSHDPQSSSFRSELNNLFFAQFYYLKGLNKIGEKQFKKIEEILESIPDSDLKRDTMNLIEDYKGNYMSSMSRKLRSGTIFHIHAEEISDLHYTESSATSRNEKFSNYPHSYHRMDIWLKMDDNLESLIDKKLLKSLGLTLEDIKEFAIDFTALNSGKNDHVIKKLSKFYQNPGRPLLIPIYGKYDPTVFRQLQNEIRNHKDGDNVRLITINQYLDLFKFSGDYRNMIVDLSKLAGLALGGDKDAFDKLAEYDITNPNILQKSLMDFN